MTHNLALSLKHHSPNVKIHLFITDELRQHINEADYETIVPIKHDDYNDHRGIAPAKIKARIYELGRSIGLESFLYLDVDAIVLNDIEPFLHALKGSKVATEIIDKGGKDDNVNYSIWATSDNIWQFFELADNDTLCGIQSSWMYFEHNDICGKLQEYLNYYMAVGVPFTILKQTWGLALPDELLYQGIFAKMGVIPSKPDTEKHSILFGNKKNKETVDSAEKNYYLLSIYGNDKLTQKKWLELYDRHLQSIDRVNYHPYSMLIRDKHANA